MASARGNSQMRQKQFSTEPILTCLFFALCFCDGAPALAQKQIAVSPCPSPGEAADHALVVSIDEKLELTLNDGRVLRIAGIDPPRPTPDNPDLDQKSRDTLANWLNGRDIGFQPLGTALDRWGRLPCFVFAAASASDQRLLSVGEALLDAGLARFKPSTEAKSCRTALLAAEASARAAGLGVWSDPYYMVIKATGRSVFAEKAATSVIVEGQVTNVVAGAARTTLSFGPRRGEDFSVTILQRNIKTFIAAGLNVPGLTGRVLRVRGLLDLRFGPQMEISSPDEIELITDTPIEAAMQPPPASFPSKPRP